MYFITEGFYHIWIPLGISNKDLSIVKNWATFNIPLKFYKIYDVLSCVLIASN
ncbi:MAG: hypothetical protein ACK4E2_04090 [Pseudothermotoga sp.]